MSEAFYPFVQEGTAASEDDAAIQPHYPARIAVYDDPLSTPRVEEIAPTDVRSYLEQITEATNRLAHEQGSRIPFMVIREVVENLIHAYFMQPTISILNHGNTITFSDQGPGIPHKDLARQYGTTSASDAMRKYIRGVGSGLPYVEAWMAEHDGTLEIRDNIAGGTLVTISLIPEEPEPVSGAPMGYVQPGSWQQMQAPSWQQAQPSLQGQQAGAAGMVPAQGMGYAQTGWAAAQGQGQQPYQQLSPFGTQTYDGQPTTPYPPAQTPYGYGAQMLPTPAPAAGGPVLDSFEAQVIEYLKTHATVGPSDLCSVYGRSTASWSRTLKAMDARGILYKQGQKRALTDAARAWLS